MPVSSQPGAELEAGHSPTARLGFRLGLILFLGLLLAPPPRSMHRAVRLHFAAGLRTEVAERLERAGEAAIPESEAWRRMETAVVDRRARIMMSAAAVTALVACWWMTVALPLPVTSLLPLLLLPLVGVLPVGRAALPYANPNVFLFMGGFIIALAIERWGLHRRIALHIVRLVGTGRATIVLGFMLATAGLSMWISNTATTLMMLPIGLAVVSSLAQTDGEKPGAAGHHFPAALMLGIAYAASIGGLATPIGTPPNIAFRGQFARLFPGAPEIGFGQWMLVFIPLVAVFLPLVWFVLVRVTCPVGRAPLAGGRAAVTADLRRLGPMTAPERRVLAVFLAAAGLWITRSIPVGGADFGWAGLLQRGLDAGTPAGGRFRADYVNDTTVALALAALLFLIPAGRRRAGRPGAHRAPDADAPVSAASPGAAPVEYPREYLMNWTTARRLPWGILLLFGGGFSIAEGFRASGLSVWCGQLFAGTGPASPLLVVAATCLMMTFLTEITSNTATTQVMLPILARAGPALGIHPLMLMLPATLSASCAFMLPVATPPNAIVFGSGRVAMRDMVRSGIVINLIGVAVVTAAFYLLARPLLGIDPTPPAALSAGLDPLPAIG